MTETMNFGLDLGMGALKLHGNQHSIQLISQEIGRASCRERV